MTIHCGQGAGQAFLGRHGAVFPCHGGSHLVEDGNGKAKSVQPVQKGQEDLRMIDSLSASSRAVYALSPCPPAADRPARSAARASVLRRSVIGLKT